MLEVGHEPWVSVTHACLGETVVTEGIVYKERAAWGAVTLFRTAASRTILLSRQTNTNMPVWPRASTGSSKMKSMLTERQQSAGSGKLIKGADAVGAGVTR
ncbi:hypothetical protein PF003_g10185 [Phytophthora fragariae]|nr:hypothetical protein PF003_g10185 [Phytophthora fragariae]